MFIILYFVNVKFEYIKKYQEKKQLFLLFRFKNVKRVETYNEGTKVVIYFSGIEKKEMCPTVQEYYRIC